MGVLDMRDGGDVKWWVGWGCDSDPGRRVPPVSRARLPAGVMPRSVLLQLSGVFGSAALPRSL